MTSTGLRRLALVPALVVMGLMVAPWGAAASAPSVRPVADTSDFTFDSFDADYQLSRDSDGASHLLVTETLVAEFPESDQNHGPVRAIPTDYKNVDLDLSVLSVTDGSGTPIGYQEEDNDGFRELRIGDPDLFVHGTTTYVISYEMTNVVGAFADTASDEFYWDVNGTGWDQPFGRVSATLHVDPQLVPALTGKSACYVGADGASGECTVTSSDEATFAASSPPLQPGENLTIAVGFASGTFVVPPPGGLPLWLVIALVVLNVVLALIVLIVAIAVRVRSGRQERGRGIIVPQYSVPAGLNVMVAAHLVGKSSTAIPAQLVSLAVRRIIRILDYPVTATGGTYTLELLPPAGARDAPDDLETQLLDALFGAGARPGTVRELVKNDVPLGKKVRLLTKAATDRVVSLGYRSKIPVLPTVLAVVIVVLGIGAVIDLGLAGAANLIAIGAAAFGVVILAAIGVFLCVRWVGPLTPTGAEQRDYLRGMRDYLELAEKDRFRMLQSPDGAERVDVGDKREMIKLYEKLLPFAIIWGVENKWARELAIRADELGERPDWYASNSAFTSVAFATSISGLSSTSSLASAWSSTNSSGSSFGGGSSGGGFSGGGGGGGGGGGW